MNRRADEQLAGQLQQKLLSQGLRSPCRVTVTVKDGVVTLAGTVQHDYQKRTALRACRAESGVKRVVNNLQAPGFKNVWASRKEWDHVPTKKELPHTDTPKTDQPDDVEPPGAEQP